MWTVRISLVWRGWESNGPIRARKLLKAAKRQLGLRAIHIDGDSFGVITVMRLTTECSREHLDCRIDDLRYLAEHSYNCQISVLEVNHAISTTRFHQRPGRPGRCIPAIPTIVPHRKPDSTN